MYSPLEKSSRISHFQRRRITYLLLVAICAFLLVVLASSKHDLTSRFRMNGTGGMKGGGMPKRRNVVVASEFSQHFDVHLATAHTIRQVLGDRGSLQVFARTPLRHGFQDVVDALDLYDQPIRDPDDFIRAMNATSEDGNGLGDGMIDLVLFGTCEVDMPRWSDELLAIWDARPADQKFKVVCTVHHFRDTRWQKHITPWAARGAIRLLPIGYHVGRAFRTYFQELADSPEPDIYSALYEYIDIDVHAPVLDLPEYGQRRESTKLSRAVIQGNFQIDRRDYPHIFADLLEVLKHDSQTWGYRPLGYDRDVYEPLFDSPNEPFELHLLGDGQLDIPKALSNIVFIHNGLDYVDFYALMQSMDVVVPAFVNKDYYDYQASSTVAMAVQCNVPILASRRMRNAYGYIDDDRVTIVRPQALREVHALGALRGVKWKLSQSNAVVSTQTDGYKKYEDDVQEMIEGGWRRSSSGFERFKEELWEKNREAVWRVLNDLPGEI
ncbi:uncharacterized protein FOMMEDRAFT_162331 [Fomitiporia mediterranea MF3/22]|uniref:uncharacterized protein n=1 Tax=Fomitiporia mediterranea (strain MF3/22) TaxID=694068 RepID=UPI0004407B69|nr:uncharacterized protein FOMMEDRAFT_162331 [Fomitiporia mediterranea MF3/22]EJC97990.1 hypothetical protein FOMMEDRAFT_162331 [Fomitiporia mediterranea MF3/22]